MKELAIVARYPVDPIPRMPCSLATDFQLQMKSSSEIDRSLLLSFLSSQLIADLAQPSDRILTRTLQLL